MMGKVYSRNIFRLFFLLSIDTLGMLEIAEIFWGGDLSDQVFLGYRANTGAKLM